MEFLFAEPVREWQWQLTRFQEFVQCFATMYFRRFLARNDNNGNVLCTGAWFMEKKGIDFTMAMIHAWLFSGYTGTHEDGMQALSRLDHKKYQEVM